MHQFASGQAAAVGLVGSEGGPPLSTETIGRAPSNFEAAPVPLKSFEAMLAERKGSAPATETDHETAPAADVRRIVVRLLGGDELELGTYDGRDDAVAAARELVSRFGEAEAAGDWAEVEDRFVRPASVASVDILVCG